MPKTAKKTNKKEDMKREVVKTEQTKGKQQIMRGRVVSAKLPKTATVLVERKKTHPLYGKSFIRTKKYLTVDELGVSLGDVVEIAKVRPVSKNKHFAIMKVLGRDIEAVVTEQLKEEAAEEIAEVMPAEKMEEVVEEVKEEKKEKKSIKKESKK